MDLSQDQCSAIEQTCYDKVEVVQEAAEDAAVCVTPAPVTCEASSIPEMIPMSCDDCNKTSDVYLSNTDEIPDRLVSCTTVSDSNPGQVETDNLANQPELLLKPAEIETVCDNDQSVQFSVADVGNESHHSLPPFIEQSEECGDVSGLVQQAVKDESVGVRDSGEESQQLSCELGSRSQSPMSFAVQLHEDSECSLQSLPPGERGPTNFSIGLARSSESYLTSVGNITAEYLEDDSRCSQLSGRENDEPEPDLLMEVETGSTVSEAVSVKESCTTLYLSSTEATLSGSQKSTGRTDDKNKSRIRKRLMVETAAETEDGQEEVLQVFEYQWPPNDKSAEWFVLQEHISEFLGVVSFKRKYPDISRRSVDVHERQFLQDSKVVTEMQCDLGLTVLRADEVYDIMEHDYPEKFKEYSSIIHKRQRQKEFDQQKAVEPPTEKTKLETLIAKSVKSAADFNASLMRELRHERQAYFDLQTYELHYPRGRMKVISPEATQIGRYPLAVLPGQFQDYCRRYTSDELRSLPVNTVLNGRRDESQQDTVNEQTDAAAAATTTTNGGGGNGSVADEDDKNLQSEAVGPGPVTETEAESTTSTADVTSESRADTVTVDTELAAATAAKVRCLLNRRKLAAEPEVEKVKCVACGRSDKNKFDEVQDMICCAVCSSSGHPSCLDLTEEMIPIIKSYDWQCMECKACVKCMKPHDEEKMMFCDHCDRGYHTFCVGLKVIPAGRWECPSCAPAAATPPKPKRGRPFKYPRPVTQTPNTAGGPAPVQQ